MKRVLPGVSTVSTVLQRNRDSERKQPVVFVRLDRLVVCGWLGPPICIKELKGFKVLSDFSPSPQGSKQTFERVRKFKSVTNSTSVAEQYYPAMPWLPNCRFTIIADDQSGISLDELESVLIDVPDHRITLFELAFDFPAEFKVNEEFVLRYGLFGKSRRRRERTSGLLRYGSRKSTKLVRAYWKPPISSFRVELEIHSTLLRKYGARKVKDFPQLAGKLYPAHIRFAFLSKKTLRKYLTRRFGQAGEAIGEKACNRAEVSLRRAMRYLTRQGIANVSRFLRPHPINRKIEEALKTWVDRFSALGKEDAQRSREGRA